MFAVPGADGSMSITFAGSRSKTSFADPKRVKNRERLQISVLHRRDKIDPPRWKPTCARQSSIHITLVGEMLDLLLGFVSFDSG